MFYMHVSYVWYVGFVNIEWMHGSVHTVYARKNRRRLYCMYIPYHNTHRLYAYTPNNNTCMCV